jgi:hypothetical protein
LPNDVAGGGGDAAGEEGGDVQLLPRLQVLAHGDGDLGVKTHGRHLADARAGRS